MASYLSLSALSHRHHHLNSYFAWVTLRTACLSSHLWETAFPAPLVMKHHYVIVLLWSSFLACPVLPGQVFSSWNYPPWASTLCSWPVSSLLDTESCAVLVPSPHSWGGFSGLLPWCPRPSSPASNRCSTACFHLVTFTVFKFTYSFCIVFFHLYITYYLFGWLVLLF
jgi:hypothetical protein